MTLDAWLVPGGCPSTDPRSGERCILLPGHSGAHESVRLAWHNDSNPDSEARLVEILLANERRRYGSGGSVRKPRDSAQV